MPRTPHRTPPRRSRRTRGRRRWSRQRDAGCRRPRRPAGRPVARPPRRSPPPPGRVRPRWSPSPSTTRLGTTTQPFGPEHAADHGDATVTHSWVFNGSAALHGALGAGSVRHGEYLLQLAAAWEPRARAAETGCRRSAPRRTSSTPATPRPSPSGRSGTSSVRRTCSVSPGGARTTSPGRSPTSRSSSTTSACSRTRPLKPAGEAFAALARSGATSTAVPPSTAIVLDDVRPDGSPRSDTRADCAPGGRFAAAWLDCAESAPDGRGPQVLLSAHGSATPP